MHANVYNSYTMNEETVFGKAAVAIAKPLSSHGRP